METYAVKLSSSGPMLMHSDKLADPLLPETKRLKAMTSDKTLKATDEGKMMIARHEYLNSLYLSAENRVVLPILNVRKSLIEGARLFKGGKEVERGVIFLDQEAPLLYDGPKDPEKLWEDQRFVDSRSVVVGRSRVIRYRPVFREWSVEVQFMVNSELIDIANLQRYWEMAGNVSGIGDFRPLFGRYQIEFI